MVTNEEDFVVISREATEELPEVKYGFSDTEKGGTELGNYETDAGDALSWTASKGFQAQAEETGYLESSAFSELDTSFRTRRGLGASLKNKRILTFLSLLVLAIAPLLVSRCASGSCVAGESKLKGNIEGKPTDPSSAIGEVTDASIVVHGKGPDPSLVVEGKGPDASVVVEEERLDPTSIVEGKGPEPSVPVDRQPTDQSIVGALGEEEQETDAVTKLQGRVTKLAKRLVDVAHTVERWTRGCRQELMHMFPVSGMTPGVLAAHELLHLLRNIESAVGSEIGWLSTDLHRSIQSIVRAPPGSGAPPDHLIDMRPLRNTLRAAPNVRTQVLNTLENVLQLVDILEREAKVILWQEASLLHLATSLENQPVVLLNELNVLLEQRRSLSSADSDEVAREILTPGPTRVFNSLLQREQSLVKEMRSALLFSSLLQTEQSLIEEMQSALLKSSPGLERTGMDNALRTTIEMQQHFVTAVKFILEGSADRVPYSVLKKSLALRNMIADQGALLRSSVSQASLRAKVELSAADLLQGGGLPHPLEELAFALDQASDIERMVGRIEADALESSLQSDSGSEEDLFIGVNGSNAGIAIDSVLDMFQARRDGAPNSGPSQ